MEIRPIKPAREISELRFLVVDDHGFQVRTLARMLRGLGAADVQTADGGRSALALLASGGHFDVVITDMEMPDLDGAQLVEQVAAVYPGTRFILTSAMAQDEAAKIAGRKPVGFLPKPITSSALVQMLVTPPT